MDRNSRSQELNGKTAIIVKYLDPWDSNLQDHISRILHNDITTYILILCGMEMAR